MRLRSTLTALTAAAATVTSLLIPVPTQASSVLLPAQSSSDQAVSIIDSRESYGDNVRVLTSKDGFPVVIAPNRTTRALEVINCRDLVCNANSEVVEVSSGNAYNFDATMPADGLPVIVRSFSQGVEIIKCRNVRCTDVTVTPVSTLSWPLFNFGSVAIATRSDSTPIVSWAWTWAGELRTIACSQPDCSGSRSQQTQETTSTLRHTTDIAVAVNGHAQIVTSDSRGNAWLLRCTDRNCVNTTREDLNGVVFRPNIDASGKNVSIAWISWDSVAWKMDCFSFDCDRPAAISEPGLRVDAVAVESIGKGQEVVTYTGGKSQLFAAKCTATCEQALVISGGAGRPDAISTGVAISHGRFGATVVAPTIRGGNILVGWMR